MYSVERPNLKIPLNWKDKAIILIATIPIILTLIYLKIVWRNIPEIVPTHFGFYGTPDSYGNRTSLFIIIGISAAVHILLSVLSKVPKYYNYPVPVTEKNAEVLYGIGRQLLLITDLEVTIMLSWMTVENIQVALGERSGVTVGIIFITIGFLFITLIYEIIRMCKVKS